MIQFSKGDSHFNGHIGPDSTFLPQDKSKTSSFKVEDSLRLWRDMEPVNRQHSICHHKDTAVTVSNTAFWNVGFSPKFIRYVITYVKKRTWLGASGHVIFCISSRNIITVFCWQVICEDVFQFRFLALCNLQSPTIRSTISSYGQSRGKPSILDPIRTKAFFKRKLIK